MAGEGTGPLARRRLAARRREITFGRLCTRPGRPPAGECLSRKALVRSERS